MPRGIPNKPKPTEVPLPPVWIDEDDDGLVEPVGYAPGAGDYPPMLIEDDDEVIRAVVPVEQIPATHHLVVGMGTLAAMSEEEFGAKLDVMKRGQERLRRIMQELLVEGEDYGRVKGIDKPFLHQPGAEKLSNFYGLAVEQIAERLIGDGIESPNLAYHVRSLVHLGDFSGPVVAQGYGESSSWEEKNRYRWENSSCPECGHELIRRKSPPQLEGKLQCPAWGGKGGCNRVYEPNDPRIKPSQRIENPDPWSLAETILLMSAKRSLVSAIRRATGTSGLFTQDPDSPSVQQQAGDTGPADAPINVEAAPGIAVGVGAKTTEATQLQHDELARIAKDKGLNGAKIADLLGRLFNMDVEPTGRTASTAVRTLDAEAMGTLLRAVSTGEVPESPADRRARIENEPVAGFPPQQSDEM